MTTTTTIPRSSRSAPAITIALTLALAACTALAGCEEKMRTKKKGAGTTTAAPAAPQPDAEPGPILGRRTQDVRNAETEIQQGARVATQKITARDPITLQGNAYVSMIGQTSILQIDHAMNLYKATNDRYPKDYDEFMAEIIRANNIALPKLPAYQKYAYDEKAHKLVILEDENLKNAPVR